MPDLAQDLRYSLRTLSKSPGFTAIAALTLALGIGVNSAIFSVIDAVMLRPLPYAEPDRLVALWEHDARHPLARNSVSPANLIDYLRDSRSFTGIASYHWRGYNLTQSGPPERVWGLQITHNFFPLLGGQPELGRSILPEEDRPGHDRVVVLGHEIWQQRFSGDPHILGQTLTLDGEKYQVIGVLPAGFQPPAQFGSLERIQLYVPAAYPADLLANHGDHEVQAYARLKPGVTVEQAQSDLDAISVRLEKEYPETNKDWRVSIAPLQQEIVRGVRPSLMVLLGAVGLILLIACVNVANLLLVRAAGRRREIAIRAALGASRWRLIRELLTQSAVLAILGCLCGLVLGLWWKDLLLSLAPANIPRLDQVHMNGRVLAFTSILAAATGLLFGVFPALQVSKIRPGESLKAAGERVVAGSSVMRWRSALTITEVALSLMLLVGAGLMLKSFFLLNAVDLGFQAERVLAMNINLPETRYSTADRRLAFFEDLAARVGGLPGVQSVAYANRFPLRGGWGGSIQIEGMAQDSARMDVDLQAISPGYCQTLGIPLLRGRDVEFSDRTGAPGVALVNEAFRRLYFGTLDAVGKRFRRGARAPWITIVGVVGDIHREGKAAGVTAQAYIPAAQTDLYPVRLADFAVRAAGGDPRNLTAAIQKEVWQIDPDQPVANVKTLTETISQSVAPRRFQMTLLLLLASLAVALALIGIWGTVAYSVSQRIPEIGIRIALGASAGEIVWMVIRQAMVLVTAGVVVGLAGAWALSRFLQGLLFAIKPTDAGTFAAVAVMLAAVALLACYLPARRAACVDPMVALRYE